MNDASPSVRQDEEDVEHAECRCRNSEEIHGDDIFGMVRQKRTPGLGRRFSVADHVLRDGGLADLKPKFEEFAVNPRGTPKGIMSGHLADEITDLGGNPAPTRPSRTAFPSPVEAKPSPVPPDDGLGLDDGQRMSPVGPDSGQYDPQRSIPIGQAGPFGGPA